MSREVIIKNLFLSKNFNDCIARMEPEHLREDLRSEVILIICEMPADKIIGLHNRKELEFYTVRIILNLIKSDTSPFAKTYRQTHEPIMIAANEFGARETDLACDPDNADTLEDRFIREHIEDYAMSEIDNLYWYDKEMILMYKRLGNFRAIEDETGIPFISCYKNIKKSLQLLKDKALKANVPVFSKEDIAFIKTNKP
jgi:hypothetical protein